MTLQELHQLISRKEIPEVLFLYGEEEFLIERTVRAVRDAVLAGGDTVFNATTYWGSETTAAEIVATANAFPFHGERRFVLVKEATKILLDQKLASYVKNPSPDTVLVLTAETLPRKSTRGKQTADMFAVDYLQSAQNRFGRDVTVELRRMTDSVAAKWVESEFSRLGKSITPRAAQLLQAMKGVSARELASEIEKIALAQTGVERIEEQHILDALKASRRYTVFDFSNAVFAREASQAIEIGLELVQHESPVMIIAHLSRQFSYLWRIDEHGKPTDTEARRIGLTWGWQYAQMQKFRKNYTDPGTFEQVFAYLLAADIELKSRGTDPATIISRLVCQITATSPLK
ncbi:MAG: DNA polymerase III subunit delta [Bacteroidota bacterium]|nr:DNA polymerase III subunit delta [Bacteroidota bacterium]